MRTGRHRVISSSLPYLTAAAAALLIGTAANTLLAASSVRQWTVTFTLPVIGQETVPAVGAFTALVGGTAAVLVLTVWVAARVAGRRRRWHKRGPTVLRGDTAARATRTAGEVGIQLARVEHDIRANTHDITTNARDIAMLRNHIRGVSEALAGAYEDAGHPPPELPPLEEPDTWWVPRVIKGGAGLDEAG